MGMILKPQDILVALKLVALNGRPWSYVLLAHELSMSASEINAGVKRALRSRLLVQTVLNMLFHRITALSCAA